MSLYVIGDTHLSLGCEKPMDVFGGRWTNYVEKLLDGFSFVKPEDTTVLCGDLSWGMNLDQAREDFLFLHRLPGRKIILKGNHDYWFETAAKLRRFFAENGIDSMELLRLEASLKAAGEREKLVFLHYPPKLLNYECTELLDLMEAYGVRRCCYGHLHSAGRALAFEGEYRGIRFRLVSADHLHFIPLRLL